MVIAGTHSGCGKTLVTLALAAALGARGFSVQGFKVGPDFIDPTHMTAVTGRTAHNLDGWMLGRDVILELFQRYSAEADFCLVEGVMGLYDGASGVDEAGCTAQMAKWLGLPVLLVIDARAQSRSIAALARGFRDFDPELNLVGIICTKVGGPGHALMLREALAAYLPELPCLGCLPRRMDLALPSRHLGLHTAQDVAWEAGRKALLAAWIEQDADVPGLVVLAEKEARLQEAYLQNNPAISTIISGSYGSTGVRLAVAWDRAFCFYYQENLDLLRRAGAEPVFFSPLKDKNLPQDVQGLYLGGGYPELYAPELSANESMLASVLQAVRQGLPVYAECGGLLYLLSSLKNSEGAVYPMAGVFPLQARMHSRFQALGYREVVFSSDCLLGSKGTILRGHEFHYSGLEESPGFGPQTAYLVKDRLGREFAEGFVQGNVLASYIHLHFGSQPQAAKSLVAACSAWRSLAHYDIPRTRLGWEP